MKHLLTACLCVLALSACASSRLLSPTLQARLAAQVELSATPFYAQDEFQCGPAALATALGASGVTIAPQALVDKVYLPGRQGSLQLEMLAEPARHGRVATLIRPELDALLTEVAAGHPVLVLQNMGLSWAPSWHYAVVIGYDLAQQELVLRSGPYPRQRLSFRVFDNTWARSGRWGFVALPPARLPAAASLDQTIAALMRFARVAPATAVLSGFDAAIKAYPGNRELAIGLAEAALAAGEPVRAEAALRSALRAQPQDAVLLNNLAQLLLQQGRAREALPLAEQAVAQGGHWLAASQATLAAVRAKLN